MIAALQRHATILFGAHGGLRRNGIRDAIKFSVDVRKRSGRLALTSRRQVLIQSSLSGIDGCLRIDHGRLAISGGRRVSGCRRGGSWRCRPGLCRQARDVDRQGDARKRTHLVLPGVGALRVTTAREAGNIVGVVSVESGSVEAIRGSGIAGRVKSGHIG